MNINKVNLIRPVLSFKIINNFTNIIFWIFILFVLLINTWYSGAVNVDTHFAFITYLAGMVANGFISGVDFVVTHGFISPIVWGLLSKFFGLGQVNLCISAFLIYFCIIFFTYLTSRFVLSDFFAKISSLLMLLAIVGNGIPWFNHIAMSFIAISIYFISSYFIKCESNYKLIIVGLCVAILPYIRHQAIVQSFIFLTLPFFAYYFSIIKREQAIKTFKYIFVTCILLNLGIFLLVILNSGWNTFSLTAFVSPFYDQPHVRGLFSFKNIIEALVFHVFMFGVTQEYYWGGFVFYIRDWYLVIISCIYFILYNLKILNKESGNKLYFILFISALLTLSTVVFNFPYGDEHRLRVQYSIGLWLVVYFFIKLFYLPNFKYITIIIITSLLFLLYSGRINRTIQVTTLSLNTIIFNKHDLVKISKGSAFSGMLLKQEMADEINTAIAKIKEYENIHKGVSAIYDGQGFGGYSMLLYLSAERPELQDNYPYAFSELRNIKFPNRQDNLKSYLDKNKPILFQIIGNLIPEGYEILYKSANDSVLAFQVSVHKP